jgi:HEAT repeat protein
VISEDPSTKALSKPELEALYGFLLENHPEDDTQRGHALKSDLMDALCAQPILPPDLSQVLAELYHDPDQNVVIRDYAIQHLALFHERLDALAWPASEMEAQRHPIQTVLWEALTETDSSIAGTALLALARSIKTDDADAQARLTIAALRLANDPAVSPLVRISAIQICAQAKVQAALPLLAQTAERDPNLALRISAIGALGTLGDRNAIELLNRIAQEQNPRLKPAVTKALASLDHHR